MLIKRPLIHVAWDFVAIVRRSRWRSQDGRVEEVVQDRLQNATMGLRVVATGKETSSLTVYMT